MKAVEEIWQEHHARLRAFIKKRIFEDMAADDVLQNVFLKMDAGLTSLNDETKLTSWLYQTTRNAIIDHFRSQKPTEELPEWLPQPVTDPGDQAVRELSACLESMIQRLPKACREAVILSELKGLKHKDVADAQGISLAGAKSRVQRGRARLGKMLAECCRLEFDHQGRLCGYERKDGDYGMC
jgi:RNA polymerase sigma-70 factor (ECF subfamily)